MKRRQYLLTINSFVWLLFFILTDAAAQQEYILKGELRDQLNKNEPVPMATITIANTKLSAMTDNNGRFTLRITPADLEQKIIVSVIGYSSIKLGLQQKNYWSVTYKNFQVNFWLDKITNARADSDNDKVPDEVDKCPSEAGTSDNYGCPELTNAAIKKNTWNFKTVNAVTKKDVAGQEKEADVKQFLKYEVNTTRILPTASSEKLIIALNPKLKDNAKIKNGETIMMPVLPEISAKRIQELNEDYETELSIDEKGQFEFVRLANLYESIIEKIPPPEKQPAVANKMQSVKKLLSEAKFGPYKKLRKVDTDMLNAEIDFFNKSYMRSRGRRVDSADVEEMYFTVSTLLKPYLSKRVKPEIFYKNDMLKSRTNINGPSFSEEEEFYADAAWFDEIPQSEIAVNFYIYNSSGSISTDSFTVYCLSESFYNKLNNGRTTLLEMKMKGFHCPKFATPAGKALNPSFKWFFIAVKKNETTKIAGIEIYNGREIELDTRSNGSTTSYAVPIIID